MLAQLRGVFRATEIAAKVVAATANQDAAGTGTGTGMPEAEIVTALENLDAIWEQLFPAEQNRLLHLLLERVEVAADGFRLRLRADGLRSVANELAGNAKEHAA